MCSVPCCCSVAHSLQPHGLSTPGFPVLHHFLELAQTHVHRVDNAIQPSHLSSLLLSIFPSIRIFTNESTLCIRWPKHWNFSFSISPFNVYSGLISFKMDWFDFLGVRGILKSLLQHHSSKASILWQSAFCIVWLSHPYMTTGKNIALTRRTFVGKVMSLLFNTLSRLVIAFLPKSKHLLISWLQLPSTVILEPKKIKFVTVSIVCPSICHEVMGLDAMILKLSWLLSQLFHSPLSPSSKRLFNFSWLSAIKVVSSAYLRLLIFLPEILIPACASSSSLPTTYYFQSTKTIVVRFFLKHYFLLIFQGYKVLTFSFLLKYNFLGPNFRDTFAQSWVYQMINSLILVNVNKSANLQNSMFGNYIKSLKANMLFCKSVCWANCQFAFGLLTKICKLPSSLIFLLISPLSYL